MIAGFGAMVVVSLIDYKWIMNFYWILYVINLILLIAVKIPGLGHSANGAQRWINLGFMQLQPSDLTKILLIIFFARFFSDRELKISSPKVIIQSVALLIPSLILIVTQPNLSTTICIAALFCALIFLAGLNYKFVGTVLAITIPAVAIFLAVAVQPNQPFLHDYQQDRILAWLEPEKYADDESYQQLNSVMAIGSGQLSGKGYNNDATTSVKNGNFVSEPQTDFIFAIIGEELDCGFVAESCFVIINCNTMYLHRFKSGECRRTHYLPWRSAASWHSKFHQYQCGNFDSSEHKSFAFPLSAGHIHRMFLYGNRLVLNVGLQPNKYQ